jgi:hypothetical protein
MVQTRNVELGQIVGPGSPLLSFVGTQNYWVQVSIPIERLAWISIPGVGGQSEGSAVKILHSIGSEQIEKEGKVLRLLSEVDPAGRMARLLIEVSDPLGLGPVGGDPSAPVVKAETPVETSSQLPLLLGTYVEVEIQGRQAERVVELNRAALRGGDTVYIMKADSTLEKRKVEVLWRREKVVLVSSGISAGEKVIISPLGSAIEGMLLRLPGHKPAAHEPAAASDEAPEGTKPAATAPAEPKAASAEVTEAKAGQSL